MRVVYLLVCLTIWINLNGQYTDTVSGSGILMKSYIVPIGLLGTSIILNQEETKTSIQDWVRDRTEGSGIRTSSIDDYLQHAPIIMLYGSDLIAGRPTSEVNHQTRHLLVTQALTLGTTFLLKEITQEVRPNGGTLSFPSGHTSYAFAGATVFWYSWKDELPRLAWAGYVPALVTGMMRVIKDKHWSSDVVLGAGLGILCGHLTCDLNIWKSKKPTNSAKDFSISLGAAPSGIGLVLTF